MTKKICLDAHFRIYQKMLPNMRIMCWWLVNTRGFVISVKKTRAAIMMKYEEVKKNPNYYD